MQQRYCMQLARRKTPLEIHFVYIGNKDIYYIFETYCSIFNVHGSAVHRNNILISPSKMHMLQSLLTIAQHVSGIIITHLQGHKTTVTTASGNRYTVIDRVRFLLLKSTYRLD